MKILSLAVLAATTFLSTNAFAAKPTEYFSSVNQVIEQDSQVSRISKKMLKEGFIEQGCDTHNVYYFITPDTTEYLSASIECSYYLPPEGYTLSTTYASVKYGVLYNQEIGGYRADNTVDVSYTTVY